jgi:hypothetical protein
MRMQAQSQIDYSANELGSKKKEGMIGVHFGENLSDQKARGRS